MNDTATVTDGRTLPAHKRFPDAPDLELALVLDMAGDETMNGIPLSDKIKLADAMIDHVADGRPPPRRVFARSSKSDPKWMEGKWARGVALTRLLLARRAP